MAELHQLENFARIGEGKFPYNADDKSATPEWVTNAINYLRSGGNIPSEPTNNQEPTKLQASMKLTRNSKPEEKHKITITLELELKELSGSRYMDIAIPWKPDAKEHLKVIYVHARKAEGDEPNIVYYENEEVLFCTESSRLHAEGPLVVPIEDTDSLIVLVCPDKAYAPFQGQKRLYCLATNIHMRPAPEWESYESSYLDDSNFV
jgi:hypothetical protein